MNRGLGWGGLENWERPDGMPTAVTVTGRKAALVPSSCHFFLANFAGQYSEDP